MEVREIVQRARALRSNSTNAERHLWKQLRGKQVEDFRFRRQRPIGKYIVDFVCLEARLIIELDGGQHAVQAGYDAERDAFLRREGFEVLRFWNGDVFKNLDGVLALILKALHRGTEPAPIPTFPREAGEGATSSRCLGSFPCQGEGRDGVDSEGTSLVGVTK